MNARDNFFIPTKTVFIHLWKLCSRTSLADQLLESSLGVPHVVILHRNEIGLGGGFHFDPFHLRLLAQDVQSRPLKSVNELRRPSKV
jgi:hypothetical protein